MTERLFSGVRIEVDVTPRWFSPESVATFFEDVGDIARALQASESPLLRLAQDIQVGVTGVRLVVAVPPGQSTDAFEAERVRLVEKLDALDVLSARRARVTAHRAAAQAAKAEVTRDGASDPRPDVAAAA